MGKTPIQWTDHSINPLRARNIETGCLGHFCVKISAGCKLCYSSRLQPRFGTFAFLAENRDKVELFLDESKLQDVIRRRVATKYFWCDMTDMFLEDYPDEWIDSCFATMALTPQHTHQVLTKRPERMLKYFEDFNYRNEQIGICAELASGFDRYLRGAECEAITGCGDDEIARWRLPFKNVWLGTSVENQDAADERRDSMRQLAAQGWTTFVSYEPAIGPVDWAGWEFLRWGIIGGESGPGARPFDVDWARSAVVQWHASGTAAFVKQYGSNPYETQKGDFFHGGLQGTKNFLCLKDRKGGDWDEWSEALRVREFPEARA